LCGQILQSIEGPVTKVIAVIVIITTGLSPAFGDAGRRAETRPTVARARTVRCTEKAHGGVDLRSSR
jgi:hypothetical protein